MYKMRYSLEPHYRRYVQGQGFMSFARNIGNKYGKKIFDKSLDVGKSMKKKYGKKILDNSLSAGKDFAKIAGKKVLIKSAEATGDLISSVKWGLLARNEVGLFQIFDHLKTIKKH